MKRYREVIGGSVFFLFAATYFVMAFQIPTFNDGFISSDFMPKVYGAILMLLSVIQIIQGVLNKKHADCQEENQTDLTIQQIAFSVALTFVLLIGYVGLLELVGFVIMSSIFIFLMTMWLLPKDQRNKKQIILSAIIAVVFASCVYLLFVKGFALTLPAGILG